MKKMNIPLSCKQIAKMIDSGAILFDSPIQRKAGQWSEEQKSLLVHSLIAGFPVPPIYSIAQEGKYQVLDGKQRLTTIHDYMSNGFKLSDETPAVKTDDGIYPLAGKSFNDLSENVKDDLKSTNITGYQFTETDDNEIEEMFIRLNSGTPLSKHQLIKAKCGFDITSIITKLAENEFWGKCVLSNMAKLKDENLTIIVQAIMLISRYDIRSFSTTDILTFVECEKKLLKANLKSIEKALAYLNEAFSEKNKLFKKVHLPMLISTAIDAIENKITPQTFFNWWSSFSDKFTQNTRYQTYCGAGSIKLANVKGRADTMLDDFSKFAKK